MNDQKTRGKGRPALYASDKERKAIRAMRARERRAALKAQGVKEIRRVVRVSPEPVQSDIIDLSAVPHHRR